MDSQAIRTIVSTSDVVSATQTLARLGVSSAQVETAITDAERASVISFFSGLTEAVDTETVLARIGMATRLAIVSLRLKERESQ